MTSKHNHNAKLDQKRIERVIKDPAVRRNVAAACHLWFFVLYFWKRMTSPMAPFQKEIFKLTEDEKIKNVVIEAFRGSAKTTIVCTSYAIWSILGCQERKFVLILAQTQSQATQYLRNIKIELESNEILKADMGPFDEPDDDWRSDSIVIPKFGARITVASIEKSIRGLNHAGHRPDHHEGTVPQSAGKSPCSSAATSRNDRIRFHKTLYLRRLRVRYHRRGDIQKSERWWQESIRLLSLHAIQGPVLQRATDSGRGTSKTDPPHHR